MQYDSQTTHKPNSLTRLIVSLRVPPNAMAQQTQLRLVCLCTILFCLYISTPTNADVIDPTILDGTVSNAIFGDAMKSAQESGDTRFSQMLNEITGKSTPSETIAAMISMLDAEHSLPVAAQRYLTMNTLVLFAKERRVTEYYALANKWLNEHPRESAESKIVVSNATAGDEIVDVDAALRVYVSSTYQFVESESFNMPWTQRIEEYTNLFKPVLESNEISDSVVLVQMYYAEGIIDITDKLLASGELFKATFGNAEIQRTLYSN